MPWSQIKKIKFLVSCFLKDKFLGRLSMDMEQTDMISNTTEQ